MGKTSKKRNDAGRSTVRDVAAESPSALPARVALALILGLALLLRVLYLGNGAFWHDEVHNLMKGEHILRVYQGDLTSNHPPLFATCVAIWMRLFGTGEIAMRMLSVTLGVGTVALLYVLVRRMYDTRTALFAAFLLALSPFHIVHSQDLKEYIVEPLTSVLLIYVFYRAVEENTRRLWIAYAFTAALACYSSFFSGPLLVAINLWFLATLKNRPKRLAPWFAANTVGALLFLPYLATFISKFNNIMVNAHTWWIEQPSPKSVAYFVKSMSFGYSDARPAYIVATAIFSLVAACGLWLSLRRNWRAASLLFAWMVLPVALVYVASQYLQSSFLYRALMLYAPPFYVWTGMALAKLPTVSLRAAGAAAFALIAALPLYQWYRMDMAPLDWPHRPGTHPHRNYDEAAEYILRRWQEGDIVVHPAAATWTPFYWYGFRDKPHYFVGMSQGFIDGINMGNPRTTDDPQLAGYFPDYLHRVTQGHRRVWLVFSEWERKNLQPTAMPVWRWLKAHYTERDHAKIFQDIDIFLFEQSPDGRPIPVVERDRDDGVSRELRVADQDTTRREVLPDAGLIATPQAERRGNLAFSFAPPKEVNDLRSNAAAPRLVCVLITNQSDTESQARLMYIESDALLEVASLNPTEATTEAWQVGDYFNPAGTPPSYPFLVYGFSNQARGPCALEGSIDLPAGQYETFIHLLGLPRETSYQRIPLDIRVGNVDVFRDVPPQPNSPFYWHWVYGATVTVASAEDVPVRIVPQTTPATEKRWADIAYLAFRRSAGTGGAPGSGYGVTGPGELTIPANGEVTWTVAIDPARARFDAWLFEKGDDGKGYRIFQVFDAAD